MRNTLTIAAREIKTYFSSPMAYVIAVVFLAITGYYFVQSISIPLPEAAIRGWILPITLFFVFWSPILTMRLLAEEQKLGTLELLMTAPVRDSEIVLGKFLATLVTLLVTLALTLYYVVLLYWFGDPDAGPLFTGYVGLILYGATTLSVGLLASSFASNQIVAAIVGFGILLMLTLMDQASQLTEGITSQVLAQLSINGHFEAFARGVIDTHNVVYYVLVIVLLLFLTSRNLESRRWR